jgi:ATP-binding cassette subfamily B multidrug efflux pump
MRLFSFFESLLDPTATPADATPPAGLAAFYWFYARQARILVVALFVAGSLVALLDTTIPVFIGRVVTMVSRERPQALLRDNWRQLLGMAAILLIARPAALFLQSLVTNQAIAPGFSNLVRWQNHWHVVRQSWTFFQNDFAGRIAQRVMQTGPALRESVVSGTNAVWYILVYGTSAIALLGRSDIRLAAPILLWFAGYAVLLRIFVPRLRARSRRNSEARSTLTGRVVDSYTNILTVKLFARPTDEDAFVRAAVADHTEAFQAQLRLMTLLSFLLATLNAAMVIGTNAIAIGLWIDGRIAVGTVAMAMPLTWAISNLAGWVAQNVTMIFENVGVVQDGMKTIAVPRQMPDRPHSTVLHVARGAVRFEAVRFGYGSARGVLHGIDLAIRPGERVGLVGRSGAGKSTLVNLLLRFYEPESGRILIDGQDIGFVTQESLRVHIAMVTQDTSLLHRSIRDNIRYGRPDASEEEVWRAAERAHALEFIEGLEDWHGRRGFEAHVGERGVKLSGGQRQRIALARVILKDAPILVLDEATSALDSEVEAAIQEQLGALMKGRTVIAIAHRLSTIARLDRLVVLDQGRIVEEGSHAQLLAAGGTYSRLWRRQSGSFHTAEAALGLDAAE